MTALLDLAPADYQLKEQEETYPYTIHKSEDGTLTQIQLISPQGDTWIVETQTPTPTYLKITGSNFMSIFYETLCQNSRNLIPLHYQTSTTYYMIRELASLIDTIDEAITEPERKKDIYEKLVGQLTCILSDTGLLQ